MHRSKGPKKRGTSRRGGRGRSRRPDDEQRGKRSHARMRAGTSEPEYAESLGDTLDAAIQKAVDILGAREDEVEVEVLQEGRRGFLWFVPRVPYRVRVSWQADQTHEEMVGEADAAKPAVGEARRDRGAESRPRRERERSWSEAGTRESRARRRDRDEAPAPDRERESSFRGRSEDTDRVERPRETPRWDRERERAADPERAPRVERDRERRSDRETERRTEREPERRIHRETERREVARPVEEVVARPAPAGDPAHDAERFVSEVFERLSIPAELSARPDEVGVRVRVSGSEAEEFVAGRDGEIESALQTLTHRVVSRRAARAVPVAIEVGDGGGDREADFRTTAMRLAEEVARTGQWLETEPMPSGSRRIIHRVLADHPSVTTESQGRGFMKKVRILPKG